MLLCSNTRASAENKTCCDLWVKNCEYSFPSLLISPAVGEWQGGGGHLLSFTTPHLDKFQTVLKKNLTSMFEGP